MREGACAANPIRSRMVLTVHADAAVAVRFEAGSVGERIAVLDDAPAVLNRE